MEGTYDRCSNIQTLAVAWSRIRNTPTAGLRVSRALPSLASPSCIRSWDENGSTISPSPLPRIEKILPWTLSWWRPEVFEWIGPRVWEKGVFSPTGVGVNASGDGHQRGFEWNGAWTDVFLRHGSVKSCGVPLARVEVRNRTSCTRARTRHSCVLPRSDPRGGDRQGVECEATCNAIERWGAVHLLGFAPERMKIRFRSTP